jgi:CTP:molybdopterin cytidylyltransferase MocA
MVNLVICMAGYNTRFHDVGFDIPKYLLPWNGTTIIHDILKNFGETYQTILVANKRDIYFKDQLVETIEPLGLDVNNILYIGDTKGQAHTAAVGRAFIILCLNLPFLEDNFRLKSSTWLLL